MPLDYKPEFVFDEATFTYRMKGPTAQQIAQDLHMAFTQDIEGKLLKALIDAGWAPPKEGTSEVRAAVTTETFKAPLPAWLGPDTPELRSNLQQFVGRVCDPDATAAVAANKCPVCGDSLDTGFECTGCAYDAQEIGRGVDVSGLRIQGVDVQIVEPGTKIVDDRSGVFQIVTEDTVVFKGRTMFCTRVNFDRLKQGVKEAG